MGVISFQLPPRKRSALSSYGLVVLFILMPAAEAFSQARVLREQRLAAVKFNPLYQKVAVSPDLKHVAVTVEAGTARIAAERDAAATELADALKDRPGRQDRVARDLAQALVRDTQFVILDETRFGPFH